MRTLFIPALLALIAPPLLADPVTGPVVENFGPTWSVPEGSFNLESDQVYRVVMDVARAPEDENSPSRAIESAARFLNLHARNGIRPDQLQLAVVLHGPAAAAALDDAGHQRLFGTANASKALIQALDAAGVTIYLCGQTAAYRGYPPAELLPEIELAVSAMTVHVRLQQEGYRAILF